MNNFLQTSATDWRTLIVNLQKTNNMTSNDRGQSLITKYVWVIEAIHKARKISFKELNRRWLRDVEVSRGVEIPKRTFDNWRYVIWDMFGISIVNENRGNTAITLRMRRTSARTVSVHGSITRSA